MLERKQRVMQRKREKRKMNIEKEEDRKEG